MGEPQEGAAFYRVRAGQMRKLAENAKTAALKATFLRLEASWLRLAETAAESLSESDDSASR